MLFRKILEEKNPVIYLAFSSMRVDKTEISEHCFKVYYVRDTNLRMLPNICA